MLIDTHAHLYKEYYGDDLDRIILELAENQVAKVINVAVNPSSGFEAIQLAEKYSSLYATAGIHPTDLNKVSDDAVKIIKEQLQHPKVVAVGEIGLDYYWKEVDPLLQKKYLIKLVELALTENYPLIIHNRDADEDIYQLLAEISPQYQGVFHCYAGSLVMAEKLMKMGFSFSFTGNITYKKSDRTEIIEKLPLEKIMLETDSPYMTPMPWRGKQNNPAKIIKVAERIAEIKDIPLHQVAMITTANAIRLFNL